MTADHAGQRLDNFLFRELGDIPKSLIYRLIRKRALRVDGARAQPDLRLEVGMRVRLPALDRAPEHAGPGVPRVLIDRAEAAVMIEHPDYLVLDKPSGFAVHGGSGMVAGLIEALRAGRFGRGADGKPRFLELGHRLDRDTSGVLLVARSREALLHLQTLLHEAHAVEKCYQTLLVGDWNLEERVVCEGVIAGARDARNHRLQKAWPDMASALADIARDDVEWSRPKTARSRFDLTERFAGFSLVRVQIDTGRMHQIRVQAAELGRPVAGDLVYGDATANRVLETRGLKRMFLHAQSIRFRDRHGDDCVFDAPLPEDLHAVLATLAPGKHVPAAIRRRRMPDAGRGGLRG